MKQLLYYIKYYIIYSLYIVHIILTQIPLGTTEINFETQTDKSKKKIYKQITYIPNIESYSLHNIHEVFAFFNFKFSLICLNFKFHNFFMFLFSHLI